MKLKLNKPKRPKLDRTILHELWRRGELDYLLHKVQLKMRDVVVNRPDNAFIVVNECGRRTGKSFLGVVLALQACLQNEGITVLLIAPTMKQGNEIARSLLRIITKDAPEGLIRRKKSSMLWEVGTSELKIAGFNVFESYRGTEASLMILEEPRDVDSDTLEEAIKATLMPMLLTTKGFMIVNTTTPKVLDHYVLKNMVPRAIEYGAYNKFTIYDNPMLDKEQIDFAIQESGGSNTPYFLREFLCERISDSSSLIIPSFNEKLNTAHEHMSIRLGSCWLSGDVGGIRDKTVFHVWGISAITQKPTIVWEQVYDSNTDSVVLGNTINDLAFKYEIAPENRWIDCHGQTMVDLNKITGCQVRLPPKQDVASAIRALNSAFYMQSIEIQRNCTHSISALRSGLWNDKGTDFIRSEEFGHMDSIMSLVYGYRVRDMVKRPETVRNYLFKKAKSEVSLAPAVGKLTWRARR